MKYTANQLAHFIHKNFLLILISAYVLAGVLPQLGLWLRHIEFGEIGLADHSSVKVSLSLFMLSLLLFNAGLGIKISELKGLWKHPTALISGFLANSLVPLMLILSLRGLMGLWHNSDELQSLLVGLAMVISMPIAGSSTAWSQNANGNLSLSLGLVLLSTVLSPLITPLVLHSFGFITSGDYSEDLHEMAASQGTNMFMCVTVVVPSMLGMALHFGLGESRAVSLKPYLKLANFVLLLLLNYSNAASVLPQTICHPDVDFLSFVCATTLGLCVVAFGSGWLIARILKANKSDQAALMFSLGMNNNGTGLVLAATALADHPAVLLPMISYTLVQQVLAALVDRKMFCNTDADVDPESTRQHPG